MKRKINGIILAAVCMLLLYFSPEITSMFFVGIMTILVGFGYVLGIGRINGYAEGFNTSIIKIDDMKKISVSENWLYIKQMDSLFHNRYLDTLFSRYAKKVEGVKMAHGQILPDIENSINEDYLSLQCQKNLINIIPGTLTGIGILGTFYGLLSGLGGIRFSSVDVVVDSISALVSGIDTAFYTSIAGVTLSLIFEIIAKVSWNNMLATMLEFYEIFHSRIISSESNQKDSIQMTFYGRILKYIESEENGEEKN